MCQTGQVLLQFQGDLGSRLLKNDFPARYIARCHKLLCLRVLALLRGCRMPNKWQTWVRGCAEGKGGKCVCVAAAGDDAVRVWLHLTLQRASGHSETVDCSLPARKQGLAASANSIAGDRLSPAHHSKLSLHTD